MAKHLSNEDLINRLYEMDADPVHLSECAECRERWEQLLAKRRQVLTTPDVAPEFLAAQRREIYRRLDEGHSGFWHFRFAPALAAVSVAVLGVVLLQPDPEPAMYAEFYTEIYSMVEATEPDAAAPIYGLFEE